MTADDYKEQEQIAFSQVIEKCFGKPSFITNAAALVKLTVCGMHRQQPLI